MKNSHERGTNVGRFLPKLIRIMKLTFILLTLFTLHVTATVYSQGTKITLNMENVSIKDVMQKIESQTDFRFIYENEKINLDKKINIAVKEKNVETILDQIFDLEKINYSITENKLILINPLKSSSDSRTTETVRNAQQQKKVSGKVTDSSGASLPGVSVVIKGTTSGVITDNSGIYSLTNIPENSTLQFSFVGMKSQELKVGSNSTLNVVMEDEAIGLEEVVAIGYGTVKKETLTGSVANITSASIVSTKSENLISNIQGKVSGLMVRQLTGEPGKFNNYVSIRGFGAPLVIVDGIVRDGTADMAQINSNDIESMSVLKDAAASIYGMNAANGVIIITTKKGSEGKAQFSYSNLVGMKGATGMEKTVDAYTYRVMKNEMDRNSGTTETYTADILEKYRTNTPGYQDVDWIKLTLKPQVFQQSHNFSVKGGTKAVKYFNSFGYTEDNGLLTSGIQNYRRYNLRSTTTADLGKNLKLNVSVAGRLDKKQSPREDFLWTYKTIMVNDRGINYHTIANEDHLSVINPESKNAWALMNPDMDGYNQQRNIQFQSTVDLTYTFEKIAGLSLIATGAFDENITNSSFLQKSYDLYDYYTDQFVQKVGSNQYSNTLGLFQRSVGRLQANYVRAFDKHKLNISGIVELTSTRGDDIMAKRLYADFFTNDIIDQGTSTTASNSGKRYFGKYAAYIGRANYDYAGKYLLEVVARYDGSYRYAKVNRWAFFPSASLGWRISEESFMKDNLPTISNLKIRGSYGESGTDAGNPFNYYSAYTASVTNNSVNGYVFNPGALTVSMLAPGVVNDDLTWVTSKISNIGIDFELLKGKISGSFDLFQRKNDGVLATLIQSVPNTFGASFPQANVNSNMNKGFEISLSHRNKIGNDFSYGITANFTYSRLEYLHNENGGYSSSWNYWINSNTNRYAGKMGLYEYNGQYTSLEEYATAPLLGGTAGNSKMLPGSYKIIDVNGDGIINSSDQTYDHWTYGANVNPPKQYGLTIDASYKNFDINILFQGASGYTINYRNNDIWGYGRYPTLHEKFLDRWHTVNTTDDPYDPATKWVSGFYPALRNYNYDNTTEALVVDVWRPKATYLRLKSLEIGYSIPKALTNRFGMESVRVFINGYNLLTFCNKLLKNADPERQEADWDANLAYPLMKAYNCGININF